MVKEAREINPFGLRMPTDLRERLELAAGQAGRSLNSEIVARLNASFDVVTKDDLAHRLEQLEQNYMLMARRMEERFKAEAAERKSKRRRSA